MDAAAFLKKSGLNEKTLGQIWSFADRNGKGFLDKQGFFIALKLIALTQNNMDASIANIMATAPAPNMGDAGSPAAVPPGTGDTGWKIKLPEKAKYDKVFNNLNPVDGKVPGSVVKPVLLNSKLPLDILGKIWDLSDIDKDGFLDDDEFSVAMHLVYRALEKEPVPPALPPELIPPSKRQKKLSLAGAVPVLPAISNNATGLGSLPGSPLHKTAPPISIPGPPGLSATKPTNWVVTAAEMATYDVMFKKADSDMDGYVSGVEIRDSLIQTGAPHQVLAHIWGLVDSKSSGKVNNEQFALIMHLIHQKLQGTDPPPQLTTEMIPPSLRKTSVDGFTDDVPSIDMPTSNKEIEAITKEIELLKSEKMMLEKDRAQRDADIKIRTGEVQSLQKELDAITATLNQLETQKGEAQKRLDELDEKRSNLENNFKDLKEKCGEEQRMVDSLRSQITCQEISIKGQEEELAKLRVELNDLRGEESKLEQQVEAGQTQLETVLKSLKETHQEHQQQKLRLRQIREQADKMSSDVAELPELALHNGNHALSSDLTNFRDSPLQDNNEMVTNIPLSNGTSMSAALGISAAGGDAFTEDPFGNDRDPFQNEDPFVNHVEDPFKGEDPFSSDPFSEDPFKDETFGAPPKDEDPFKDDDPFNSAFENAAKGNTVKNDPFDPFGDKSSADAFSATNTFIADPFGTDPFTPHTPPTRPKSPKPPRPAASPIPRGKSPVPALPPKTKKAPPRPAPPRPAPPRKTPSPIPPAMRDPFNSSDPFNGGSKSNSLDPFANSSSAADAFANFADFSPAKMETDKISESEQLAWARRESIRQQELQHRAKEQEQADLELAIALSKADMGQSSA
ncbi:epidermal growth factor receptor substrate 15-like 1 [Tubulanus polymorphus]|uniref:epidermal growth factor receptor substrate 15-like 1 n=1 Tax=Tubulanus polymorphus TaxID=672921 RepID=UPI003DA4E6ED